MSNASAEFTYVQLWTAFNLLRQMYDGFACSGSQRKDDALALRLAALNMSFYALEAFLNHLIQAISPEVWKNERVCFSGRQTINGKKYYGPIGKLEFVHELCGKEYAEDADDIQTVFEIKKLRDMMAHGRSYYGEPDDLHVAELSAIPALTSQLFEIATHDLLLSATQHLGAMRTNLFEDAEKRYEALDIGPHPKSSISAMWTASYVPPISNP